MISTRACRHALAAFCLFLSSAAFAAMPTNPVTDPDFARLPNGKLLREIRVNGEPLSLSRGSGNPFTASKAAAYQKLKQETQSNPNHKVQWAFMDLDNHRMIAESASSHRKIFGASSSKIFVGATLLDQRAGDLTAGQLQLMSDMLVVSSNSAWTTLQANIGGGDSNKGRATIHAFTQRMGYERTRGFQGYWGNIHGNELVAAETVEFLHDTYKGSYPGAETLWKLMHTCRTGSERGRKYLPTNLYVGGKTGTYDGETVDPETGSPTNPDGSTYEVAVRNHVLIFNVEGKQYGLVVLADSGSDESAALLAGGLYREYAATSRDSFYSSESPGSRR